jgi:hypothetical protein
MMNMFQDTEIGAITAGGPFGNPPTSKYDKLISLAKEVPPATTIVLHPCDESSLRGACEAAELGIIVPILVGPAAIASSCTTRPSVRRVLAACRSRRLLRPMASFQRPSSWPRPTKRREVPSQAPPGRWRSQAARAICTADHWEAFQGPKIGLSRASLFAVHNVFHLKLLSTFLIFSANRKEVLEVLMTTGELFAVAILSSLIFALAAHWQSDNDGGLI